MTFKLAQRDDYQPEPAWLQLAARADWEKGQGLLPAIIQDHLSAQVLMLGYLDRAALELSLRSGWVSFFSRSRQQLWTKGESSGNGLALLDIALDCDNDSFLIQAQRLGPVCHTGSRTCWNAEQADGVGFLNELAALIHQRASAAPGGRPSYTVSLLQAGLPRIAQKVGEEGVETALAAVCADDQALLNESADLLYHLLVLLEARQLNLQQLCQVLQQRQQKSSQA